MMVPPEVVTALDTLTFLQPICVAYRAAAHSRSAYETGPDLADSGRASNLALTDRSLATMGFRETFSGRSI